MRVELDTADEVLCWECDDTATHHIVFEKDQSHVSLCAKHAIKLVHVLTHPVGG